MLKNNLIVIALLLTFFLLFSGNAYAQEDNNTLNVYMFYGQGCSHCSKMLDFFNKMEGDYPEMNLIKKEIYFNKENAKLLEDFCRRCNTSLEGVPTVFIDGKSYVGFSYALAAQIEAKIKSCIESGTCSKIADENSCEQYSTDSSPLNPNKDYSIIGWVFIGGMFVIIVYSLFTNKK